jgi:chromosome segregation ATPase
MAPNEDTNEPKKNEFGTGLRAQLERRREEEPQAEKLPGAQPNVEVRFELTARPADAEPFTVTSDGATEELRRELAAAHAREATLKAALAEQQEVFEAGMESDQGLARRASALDERDAKLAEFQAEVEARERKVRDQRETIEAEHARLAELQAELASEQQLSIEREEQAERKLNELKSFERDRSKFSHELEKQRKALADREKKLSRAEQEL